jgi:hypothetical protein
VPINQQQEAIILPRYATVAAVALSFLIPNFRNSGGLLILTISHSPYEPPWYDVKTTVTVSGGQGDVTT